MSFLSNILLKPSVYYASVWLSANYLKCSTMKFSQVWTSWKLCVTIMRLVILDNYDLASEWAAKYICNRIIQFRWIEQIFYIGLPTGNIPFSMLDTQGSEIERIFLGRMFPFYFLPYHWFNILAYKVKYIDIDSPYLKYLNSITIFLVKILTHLPLRMQKGNTEI